MFGDMRGRLWNAIDPDKRALSVPEARVLKYARPGFLQLNTLDELNASADHKVRPIIVPRDISVLPFNTGYAECVNSGKTQWNEDQAAFCCEVLSDPHKKYPDLPYTYFGMFDGHAGYGAALTASLKFHHVLRGKLVDIIDILFPKTEDERVFVRDTGLHPPYHINKNINRDEVIIGALESAFQEMDDLIRCEKSEHVGGCTALVTLFIHGKMFVANAGDSRAILCQRGTAEVVNSEEELNKDENVKKVFAVPFSFDHTPETERRRLMTTAKQGELLFGTNFMAKEFPRRLSSADVGRRMLCRQANAEGWAYKMVEKDDLKIPMVTGEGKRSRLLGTLGVTRGLGDFNLYAINCRTWIKPFLSSLPDVKIRDLSTIVSIPGENNEDGDYGILVMGTDGLWDVSANDFVAKTVFNMLDLYPTEKHRYTMAAQELVAKARGKLDDNTMSYWRSAVKKGAATVDDISVLVIPVYQYYKQHIEWKRKCAQSADKQVVTNGVSKDEVSSVTSALEATEIHNNNNVDETQNHKEQEELPSQDSEAAEP